MQIPPIKSNITSLISDSYVNDFSFFTWRQDASLVNETGVNKSANVENVFGGLAKHLLTFSVFPFFF